MAGRGFDQVFGRGGGRIRQQGNNIGRGHSSGTSRGNRFNGNSGRGNGSLRRGFTRDRMDGVSRGGHANVTPHNENGRRKNSSAGYNLGTYRNSEEDEVILQVEELPSRVFNFICSRSPGGEMSNVYSRK
ncbi:unnamed protein product [Allacma fusca]|uniref:Uncharacterized protein n=1 Tax=Allacma fusca TaxID=39272 RepID=A0A8J2JF91_9HEXA|nr:unnamed protein product [Allacma fusca]